MQRLLTPTPSTVCQRRGLSLVEVIVSMLLVGLVLVGSLRSVTGVFQAWDASQRVHDGMGLAQQLMSEILQQCYEDPNTVPVLGLEDLEDSTNRSVWDDVDDYNGWRSAPETKDGTSLPGYENWSRAVAVRLVKVSDPTQSSLLNEGLKEITVTVSDPNGRQTVLKAFRSKWGMLEQKVAVEKTVQTYIRSELQLGTGGKVHSGSHLLNHGGGT